MKLLLENWREYLNERSIECLNESKELKVQKTPNGFTLDLYINDIHIGQYTHSRDGDNARNVAEIFPEYRGMGYGTMMLLSVIKTAGDLNIAFEEDSVSMTPAMSRVYDDLYDSGMIFGSGNGWLITPDGEEELNAWMGEEEDEPSI